MFDQSRRGKESRDKPDADLLSTEQTGKKKYVGGRNKARGMEWMKGHWRENQRKRQRGTGKREIVARKKRKRTRKEGESQLGSDGERPQSVPTARGKGVEDRLVARRLGKRGGRRKEGKEEGEGRDWGDGRRDT